MSNWHFNPECWPTFDVYHVKMILCPFYTIQHLGVFWPFWGPQIWTVSKLNDNLINGTCFMHIRRGGGKTPIIRSHPGKPNQKGQFMNFSQGHSGTKIQCESCLFSQGKTPEFTKMGEIHELFVLALSLVWFARATPEISKRFCGHLGFSENSNCHRTALILNILWKCSRELLAL